ncbi:MAG: hypothetical protein HYR88_05410 [Verrucomicrobia bacterium]|nr:hypothetical protein [Verrucomicrobiota bacterium]MBI3869199.1 hypothetical protein [Verrucomicrobiota bacterium]
MKRNQYIAVGTLVAAIWIGGGLAWQSHAADAGKDAIKEVMKAYHKAPKGVDPVCKRAVDGKASAEELKKLVAGYKTLASAKPPRGDEASWKEKTAKLLAACQALEKGEEGAAAKYKEALNCKACHSAHKPE